VRTPRSPSLHAVLFSSRNITFSTLPRITHNVIAILIADLESLARDFRRDVSIIVLITCSVWFRCVLEWRRDHGARGLLFLNHHAHGGIGLGLWLWLPLLLWRLVWSLVWSLHDRWRGILLWVELSWLGRHEAVPGGTISC
jgi:hypothetical protein